MQKKKTTTTKNKQTKQQQQQQKKKKKKKNNKKTNNNNLQTGRTNTLLCRAFFLRLSREKSVKSMCYLKVYIKVYLIHKTYHA